MTRTLTKEDEKLIADILAFEIDDPQAALPFTTRLAREQNWSHVFAARVVSEYKHFIALAVVAGHPVTPSEQVDQAWHLHLVYTRSYWHDLCRDLLGQDLHHGPTKGGSEEGEKFHGWYSETLESYRKIFGQDPPADIWPASAQRFANAAAGRWIDTSKFWLFPKPRFLDKLCRKKS